MQGERQQDADADEESSVRDDLGSGAGFEGVRVVVIGGDYRDHCESLGEGGRLWVWYEGGASGARGMVLTGVLQDLQEGTMRAGGARGARGDAGRGGQDVVGAVCWWFGGERVPQNVTCAIQTAFVSSAHNPHTQSTYVYLPSRIVNLARCVTRVEASSSTVSTVFVRETVIQNTGRGGST